MHFSIPSVNLMLILNLIAVAIVLVTLPLVAELLVLSVASVLPKKQKAERLERSFAAPLTVLIPAHNEQALIGRCVRSLLASANSGVDLLVVAHNCTDATAMRARIAGANVLVLDDPGQTGKACALRHGFAAAMARPSHGVMVVDADSVVKPGVIEIVQRKLFAGTAALQCRYELICAEDRPRAKLASLAFHAFNVIRPRGRARLGLSAGILGNGFALHREVLKRVPYNAHSIVEDLEYHLALVRANIRVEFIDTAAVLGEMPATSESAKAQRARWEGGRLRVMKHRAPALLIDVVRGRLRSLEPLLDLLAFPIALEVTLLAITACLPLAWLRLYVLAAFTVLVLHVVIASVSGPGLRETLSGLASAPGYILWKLRILPDILRTSNAHAAWIRTERSPAAVDVP